MSQWTFQVETYYHGKSVVLACNWSMGVTQMGHMTTPIPDCVYNGRMDAIFDPCYVMM